jgi:hypothetical protein
LGGEKKGRRPVERRPVTKLRPQADFVIETAGKTWTVSIFISVTPSLWSYPWLRPMGPALSLKQIPAVGEIAVKTAEFAQKLLYDQVP